MEKSEALRLADALIERHGVESFEGDAAAELRRLSAENDLLGSAADKLRLMWRDEVQILIKEKDELIAQRDALLEALRSIADCCDEEHAARDYASRQAEIRGIARAAIAAVEGEKT
jgi:hypothetical protein